MSLQNEFAHKEASLIIDSLRAARTLKTHLDSEVEELWVMALSSSREVLGIKQIFRGTVDSCMSHPRDIFRYACEKNAAAIILAHNHPSQDAKPSEADLAMTRQILKASQIMQIPVLDHLILTKRDYFSFADQGLLRS